MGFWQNITGNGENTPEDNMGAARSQAEQGAALIGSSFAINASMIANLQSSPQAAAGTVAAGAKLSGQITEAIRDRYFKKEFEMAKKNKILPIINQMQADLEKYRQMSLPTMRPIQRIIGPAQGQEIAETLQGQDPIIEAVPTGKNDKNGKPITAPQMRQAPPAFNAAIASPGQYGAVETYDALSVIDPATGQPVDIDSPYFRDVHGRLTADYWDSYGRRSIELLDALTEFSGNPYADKAAKAIMDEQLRMAGQAATAEVMPDKQIEIMQQREKMRLDLDRQRQDLEKGEFDLTGLRGGRAAGAAFGREQADAPGMAGVYEGIDTSRPPKPGSPEEAKLAGIYGLGFEREKVAATLASKTGSRRPTAQDLAVNPIPTTIINKPDQWGPYLLTNDKGTQRYVEQRTLDLANTTVARLEKMDPDELRDLFRQFGADPPVQDAAAQRVWNNPQVMGIVKQIALSSGGREEAEGYALQNRLWEVARTQPGVNEYMHDLVDQMIADHESEGYEISAAERAAMHADAPRYASKYILGRDVKPDRAPGNETIYQREISRIREQRAMETAEEEQAAAQQDVERLAVTAPGPGVSPLDVAPERVPSLFSGLPSLPGQSGYRPTEGGTPKPGQPIEVSPTNEEPPPAQEPVHDMSYETERVYGFNANPIEATRTLFGVPKMVAPSAPKVQSLSQLAAERRSIVNTNPYIGQPPEMLMEVLTTLPNTRETAPVRKMIKEALAAAGGL